MPDVNQPMMVIRKRLSATEGDPPGTRYNPDTDTVETTPDGGTTWTPNPGADPRTNPAYLLPPLGADSSCQAADGMVLKMQGFVNALVIGTGVPGIGTSILGGMVFLIPGAGWLWALALGIASAALLTGAGVIAAAFDGDVWEQIKCIILCNIDDDGQVSTAQLDAIYADVDSDIGDSVVTVIVGQIFQSWGAIGMSNAGTYGDPEADCSECDACAWSYRWDFAVNDGSGDGWGQAAWLTGYGVYDPGFGWRQTPGQGLIIGIDFADTALIAVNFTGQYSSGSNGSNLNAILWRDNGSNLHVSTPGAAGNSGSYSSGDEQTLTCDNITLNPSNGSFSDQLIQTCTITGTGTMPAWTQGALV